MLLEAVAQRFCPIFRPGERPERGGRNVSDVTAGRRAGAVVHAYGEMVDVLWKAGQTPAAIRLEILWNSLRSRYTFSLLCGYAVGSFYKDAAVDEICSHHSHVMSLSGDASLIT